ncbi:hypothetical protein PPYR_04863 [Photinus pyralis]|uniref:Uncharacterized protein n=1 Tax=Photinus pyralis TaxID=7054 RepID=A0A5N4AZ97_PHOPY|nr:uncharacterized protein LOC116163151 [Photinus pyralis]KAB0802677.1 hypothetical protein PPYR_04863 [Photinus pyralis]
MGKSRKHRSRSRSVSKRELRDRLRRLESLLVSNKENLPRHYNSSGASSSGHCSRSRSNRDHSPRNGCGDTRNSNLFSSGSRYTRHTSSPHASLSTTPSPSSRRDRSPRVSLSHRDSPDLQVTFSPRPSASPEPPLVIRDDAITEPLVDENILSLENIPLDIDEFADVLGNDGPVKSTQAANLHEAIASRWTHILQNGVSLETLQKLSEQYSIPGNCSLLAPPVLNPEILSVLANDRSARDNSYKEIHSRTATALTAMGRAMSLLLQDSSIAKDLRDAILMPLGDASRILVNSLFVISDTRRKLIVPTLNNNIKEALEKTKPGELLFGANVSECVRDAKSIQTAGKELKASTGTRFSTARGGRSESFRRRDSRAFATERDGRPLNRFGPTRHRGVTRSSRGHKPHLKSYKR